MKNIVDIIDKMSSDQIVNVMNRVSAINFLKAKGFSQEQLDVEGEEIIQLLADFKRHIEIIEDKLDK
jgi:hypothetical protein